MRRRFQGARNLGPDELVAIYVDLAAQYLTASPEVRNHALREGLAEYGYTPLDVFRARHWIRRGRPADLRWDL